MATVGFIGLGVMGKPMAKRVLAAGHKAIVHNRSQHAVDELVGEGATAADGPADLAARCDIVITVLPSDTEVLEVILGEGGVLEGLAAGGSIVDMSTTKPQTAKEVGQRCEAAGVGFLDAPVSGGEVGAIAGTLSIMVGGPDQTFADARPVLEAMGGSIVHVGLNGAGQLAKAANQIIVGVTIAAVAEAFGLAQRSGVDQTRMRQALMGGFASSRILDLHGQRIIDANFTPGFRAELHLKDLEIALAAADSCGFPAVVTAHVRDLYREMVDGGGGGKDHSALFLHLTDALTNTPAS